MCDLANAFGTKGFRFSKDAVANNLSVAKVATNAATSTMNGHLVKLRAKAAKGLSLNFGLKKAAKVITF